MEFDVNVTKLQGTLMSMTKRRLFDGPGSAALDALQKVFQDVESDEARLKMYYFMVLNSTIGAGERLADDRDVGHLICLSPKLDHRKLVEWTYQLGLHPCLNAVVENCHSNFIWELVEAVIKCPALNTGGYTGCVMELWLSLFVKAKNLARCHVADEGSVKLCLLFQELNNFITGHMVKLLKGTCSDEVASCLVKYFQTILTIVRLYNGDDGHKFEPNEIFRLNTDLNVGVEHTLSEPLETCLNVIFQYLHTVTNLITVSVWLDLSDICLNPESGVTAQERIGESVYHICEETKNVASSYLECLTVFKVKPKSESEKLSEAGLDEIVSNVERGSKTSFKYLIRFDTRAGVSKESKGTTRTVFETEEVVDSISKHLDLADADDANLIADELIKVLSSGSVSGELLAKVKKLYLGVLRHVPESDYGSCLLNALVHHPEAAAHFQNDPETHQQDGNSETSASILESFNKVSSDRSIDLYEVACHCLRSREKTLRHIIRLALSGTEQANRCMTAISILRDVFVGRSSDGEDEMSVLDRVVWTLITEAGDLSEAEKKSFVSFVSRLSHEGLVDWHLYERLLSCVNSNVENEAYDTVVFQLELMKSIFELKSFDDCKFPCLVYLSHILDRFTWDLETFTTLKSDAREVGDGLIAEAMSRLQDEDGQSSRLKWARSEIGKRSELTQARFCDLWFRYSKNWTGSGSFHTLFLTLIHTRAKSQDIIDYIGQLCGSMESSRFRRHVSLSLAMLLPLLSPGEWDTLYTRLSQALGATSSESVLDIYVSAMYLLSVQLSERGDTYPCYEYCVRNFGRQVVGKSVESPFQVLEKIVFFLEAISDEKARNSCGLILTPVLVDLARRTTDTDKGTSPDDVCTLLRVANLKNVEEAFRNCRRVL